MDLNFDLILDDDYIMPFEKRYLAQRLRRSVTSSKRVQSMELDLSAMIEDFCQDRYLNNLKYLNRDYSASNIVLFSDRMGSMLAYEFIEQHLSDTIDLIPGCSFEHYYFNNLPRYNSVLDSFTFVSATDKESTLNSNEHKWNRKTWFFLLSDAGAHSPTVSKGRIKATYRFWKFLKQISSHVHWLNPVPNEYMQDCTAKRLQMRIEMHGLEQENLKAILK